MQYKVWLNVKMLTQNCDIELQNKFERIRNSVKMVFVPANILVN